MGNTESSRSMPDYRRESLARSSQGVQKREVRDVESCRRAAKTASWDWSYGMLALTDDDRPLHALRITGRSSRGRVRQGSRPRIPDLEDAATQGCCLELLSYKFGARCVLEHRKGKVRVVRPYGSEAWLNVSPWARSASSALAAAFENADRYRPVT